MVAVGRLPTGDWVVAVFLMRHLHVTTVRWTIDIHINTV